MINIYVWLGWVALLLPMMASLISVIRIIRDSRQRSRLLRIIDRYAGVREATDDFMVVAVSYLASPWRIMDQAVQAVRALGPASNDILKDLDEGLRSFAMVAQQAGADNSASAARASVHGVIPIGRAVNPFKSLWVWLPFIISVIGYAVARGLNGGRFPLDGLASTGLVAVGLAVFILARYYSAQVESSRLAVERRAALTIDLFATRRQYIKDQVTQYRQLNVRLQHASQPLKGIPQARELFKGLSWLGAISNRIERAYNASNLTADAPLLDISTFLNKALASEYLTMANARGLTIEAKIAGGLAFRITPQDFSQLMSSLFENAITFSKSAGTVQLRGVGRSQMVILSISDQGTGITTEQMDKLFKPVVPDKETIAAPALSLHINKIIMARVGGTLEIVSTPDEGTTVTVTAVRTHSPENFDIPTHILSNAGILD